MAKKMHKKSIKSKRKTVKNKAKALKNKGKAFADRVVKISAGIAAVGKNYEAHAGEVNAFAKKIKSEWQSGQRKKR